MYVISRRLRLLIETLLVVYPSQTMSFPSCDADTKLLHAQTDIQTYIQTQIHIHRVTTHTTVIWIRTLTTAIHFILSSSSYNWVTSSAYILFKSCLAISLWRATNSVHLISYLLTKVTSANQLVRKAMAHVRMSGTHTTCPMLTLWRPLLPYGYGYKASLPDRVKPSFVIFDIRALWRSALSVRVPGCQKLHMTA